MESSHNNVEEKVKIVLVDEFELDEAELSPDATLYDDLGLDSLDSVDLVVALEKAFNFKISREKDEETIRAIRTINDIYDFINAKQADI
ncbi:MAG: acyl carrier protein [Desulfobacterales bacterium]|nr:acyl carrier protein [Desulfobacterales bacterium]